MGDEGIFEVVVGALSIVFWIGLAGRITGQFDLFGFLLDALVSVLILILEVAIGALVMAAVIWFLVSGAARATIEAIIRVSAVLIRLPFALLGVSIADNQSGDIDTNTGTGGVDRRNQQSQPSKNHESTKSTEPTEPVSDVPPSAIVDEEGDIVYYEEVEQRADR